MLKIVLFLIAKLETSQMSLNWEMAKQTVVQTYNGTQLSNKTDMNYGYRQQHGSI